MNETEYAYAVARVRSNENDLLSETDISQLLAAKDFDEALRQLSDQGWGDSAVRQDYFQMLRSESEKVWDFLSEIAPDIHELDTLILRNDYHNFKTALKCTFKNHDPKEYFLYPCVYDPEELYEAVRKREFDTLPENMRGIAGECYDVLARTEDGQQADILIDRAALKSMKKAAAASNNEFLKKYAELVAVTANIKIALRAVKTGKSRVFLEEAVAEMDTLDRQKLIDAALEGKEKLFEYLLATPYAEGVQLLMESTSAFEKWCDDIIMKEVLFARHRPFGLEPLAAFYIARETEIKTVRIILSGKLNGLPAETIMERVRKLYV